MLPAESLRHMRALAIHAENMGTRDNWPYMLTDILGPLEQAVGAANANSNDLLSNPVLDTAELLE